MTLLLPPLLLGYTFTAFIRGKGRKQTHVSRHQCLFKIGAKNGAHKRITYVEYNYIELNPIRPCSQQESKVSPLIAMVDTTAG